MSRANFGLLLGVVLLLMVALWLLADVRKTVQSRKSGEAWQSFTRGGVTTPRDPNWSLDTWYEKHLEAERRFQQ